MSHGTEFEAMNGRASDANYDPVQMDMSEVKWINIYQISNLRFTKPKFVYVYIYIYTHVLQHDERHLIGKRKGC